jgi:uncharacterized protein YjbJ (UPF0337 family)
VFLRKKSAECLCVAEAIPGIQPHLNRRRSARSGTVSDSRCRLAAWLGRPRNRRSRPVVTGQKWGKLTDDDLDVVAGKGEELIGRLQERYGWAREEAEKRADAFVTSYKERVREARAR